MQSHWSIKTRAWIYILSYMGMTLLVSLTILAGSYYWFATKAMRDDLETVAAEMVTNRLTFENNSIKFLLDEEGRTLSGFLRDENMSAEIVDGKGQVIAKYGVFQNESVVKNYDINKQKTVYSDLVTKSGERYLTLSTPILFQGNNVGQLVLAIPMLVLGHLGEMGLWLMFAVLVLSMLLSWPLSHELVKIVFKSIDELVGAMEKVEIENLGNKIEYKRNNDDEVGVLVKTYNRLLDRLGEGVEKQKSFISNASHELKTPLSRMVSTLEVLSLDLKDIDQKNKIREVKDELMHLSTKVEGLLLLSRYDKAGKNIKKENFLPEEIISSVLVKHEAEINKMELRVHKLLEYNQKIYGDKMGFEVVISNLISNGIKYNRKGGSLKVSLLKNGGKIKVLVVDEGKGIDVNYIGKIFERFSRNEKTAAAIEGSGVGMSLVEQICNRNGWKIVYDREFTMGTKVELTLEV